MNVPRKPINLRKMSDARAQELTRYAEETLDGFEEVDAFILKYNSPICGIGTTKLFDSKGKSIIGHFDGGLYRDCARKVPRTQYLLMKKC